MTRLRQGYGVASPNDEMGMTIADGGLIAAELRVWRGDDRRFEISNLRSQIGDLRFDGLHIGNLRVGGLHIGDLRFDGVRIGACGFHDAERRRV
mgnify:CR=1 FL=1